MFRVTPTATVYLRSSWTPAVGLPEIVALPFVGGVAYFTVRWYLSDGDAQNSEWR